MISIYGCSTKRQPGTLPARHKTASKAVGKVAFLTVYLQERWVLGA